MCSLVGHGRIRHSTRRGRQHKQYLGGVQASKQVPTSARRRRRKDDATGRENEIWGGEFGDGMHGTATQQPAQLCSVCGTNNNLLPIIPCYTTFYQILVFITNQTFQMFLFSIHVIRFRTLKLRIPPFPTGSRHLILIPYRPSCQTDGMLMILCKNNGHHSHSVNDDIVYYTRALLCCCGLRGSEDK